LLPFIQETGVQIVTASVAFGLGLLLNRMKVTWALFRARNFWRPLLRKDLTLVLGDGFPELQGFEATDVIGRGDLIASHKLTTCFSSMGFRRLQPVFADKVIGDDPGGDSLRRNLILLGGSDANSLTQECLKHLNCHYTLLWPEDTTREATASPTSNTWGIPRLQGTENSSEDSTGKPQIAFTPIIEHGDVTQDYGVIIRTRNPFVPIRSRQEKQIVVIFGCYGFGTLAAILFSQEKAFLDLVKNTKDDIECIVVCDVVKGTPQGYRKVHFQSYPHGILNRG
jgi:hypothetical protein